jgi:hypothetical protein
MRNLYVLSFVAILLTLAFSCSKHDIDDIKPFIDLSITDAFPVNCDTLYLGDAFVFKAKLSDNVELGSYSIEIHHNFDHHAHSTEVEACEFSPKKTPVNPFHFIHDYEIPTGISSFISADTLLIPKTNTSGIIDEGDYHFYISLVDKEGWSVNKGLSVKILNR